MQFSRVQNTTITPARILIVEDEGIIASRIASSLARLGYESVGIAQSSEEALAKTGDLHPGLILMDIHIKGVSDGIETTAELLDRFDIPVIYLTAHSDRQTIERAKTTGASGLLMKPISDANLAVSIEMAIHKHRFDRIRRNDRESELIELNRSQTLLALNRGLEAEKSRYQALVKATSQIVWTTSPAGIPTDAEHDWKAFTGQTGAQVRSEAVHPDDRPTAAAKWAEAMRTGAAYEIEKRVWCARDGDYCWMLARVVPVLGSDGAILEWIGACTDISGRKRAEIEIKGLHDGLEHRVAERTAELAQATSTAMLLEHDLRINNEKLAEQTRRAEQANLAKSNFLAAMSHEIRTPMNAILGMADMMWESKLDAEQVQYVEVFRRAGSNLLVLINDILDLSKIEAGHLEMESIEFDLEDVVDESVDLVILRARAKGIDLSSHLLPGVATALMGDPNRLRQVLINILGNAVKFTESGTVALTVRTPESGRPGEIEFAISDTGIGIPPDKLETIFDDFTQADASTTRRYGGTGLGLGISRRLVENMHGRLTVSSSAGSGSTFRFNLLFELAPPGKRTSSMAIEDFSGRRVLVIDDDATSRLILRENVNAWGFESDGFGQAEEALAGLAGVMAGAQPYSLVLMDNRIGGMDGFEAAARIKRVNANLPVVMLTASPGPGDARRRQKAGLAGYAVKPVKRRDLLRLVCDALKSSAVQGQTASVKSPEEPVKPVQPLRILVVEDSPDNRLLIQVYLKGAPHQLTFAEDGKAGLDCFATAAFDLILMDMQMPVMDGLTATRTIRSIESEQGVAPTPIVALTANARPEDRAASHLAGCDDHLSKPISKAKLLSMIEEHGRREERKRK